MHLERHTPQRLGAPNGPLVTFRLVVLLRVSRLQQRYPPLEEMDSFLVNRFREASQRFSPGSSANDRKMVTDKLHDAVSRSTYELRAIAALLDLISKQDQLYFDREGENVTSARTDNVVLCPWMLSYYTCSLLNILARVAANKITREILIALLASNVVDLSIASIELPFIPGTYCKSTSAREPITVTVIGKLDNLSRYLYPGHSTDDAKILSMVARSFWKSVSVPQFHLFLNDLFHKSFNGSFNKHLCKYYSDDKQFISQRRIYMKSLLARNSTIDMRDLLTPANNEFRLRTQLERELFSTLETDIAVRLSQKVKTICGLFLPGALQSAYFNSLGRFAKNNDLFFKHQMAIGLIWNLKIPALRVQFEQLTSISLYDALVFLSFVVFLDEPGLFTFVIEMLKTKVLVGKSLMESLEYSFFRLQQIFIKTGLDPLARDIVTFAPCPLLIALIFGLNNMARIVRDTMLTLLRQESGDGPATFLLKDQLTLNVRTFCSTLVPKSDGDAFEAAALLALDDLYSK